MVLHITAVYIFAWLPVEEWRCPYATPIIVSYMYIVRNYICADSFICCHAYDYACRYLYTYVSLCC